MIPLLMARKVRRLQDEKRCRERRHPRRMLIARAGGRLRDESLGEMPSSFDKKFLKC